MPSIANMQTFLKKFKFFSPQLYQPNALLSFGEQKSLQKKYEDIDPYLEMMDETEARLSILTTSKIQPMPRIPLGCSVGRVQRKMGKPAFRLPENGLLQTDVLVFRRPFMGFPAQLELSFFNQKLFGFSCSFLTNDSADYELIKEAISCEYSISMVNHEIQKIIDSQGNTLLLKKEDTLQLHIYFTGHPLFEQLKNISVFYNRKEKSRQEENSHPIFREETRVLQTAKPARL